MALSLNAEQQSVTKIFNREEQYIIPPFQRPYSWDYDQCLQLYNDLIDAYRSQEEYFVGNIILAVNSLEAKKMEVIDGQQRLTTFFLIIKVISILDQEQNITQYLQSDNRRRETLVRLESKVIETDDPFHLTQVLSYDEAKFEERLAACLGNNGIINAKLCQHNFEQNALCYYQWLKRFKEQRDDFGGFVDYFFDNVYLLPIQLNGETSEDARRKALIIFETINNRGMSLEDADIFKAKLYEDAEKIGEEKEFIIDWKDFRNKCDDLGLQVDDIFRYYSHIVRGKNSITSSETNMRDFFINKDYSPFNNQNYKATLADLFQLINTIEYIENQQKTATPLAKWLQLIDYYSNQYPKWALVTYLFINGIDTDKEKMIVFCQSLIRYVYAKGATTTIKYEIYNIIKQVCQGGRIKAYEQNFTEESLYPLGRLKYGYALLAFYINREKALVSYHTGRIFNTKDISYLRENVAGWKGKNITDVLDYLANFIVTDIPQRNILYQNKTKEFECSDLEEIHAVFKKDYTFSRFQQRETKLVNVLLDFFNSPA